LNPITYLIHRNSQDICCHLCVYGYCGWIMLAHVEITSCKCNLHGHNIDKTKVATKSCWRFVKEKKGISLERQIENTWYNKLTRNWFKIITAIVIVIGAVLAILTYLSK